MTRIVQTLTALLVAAAPAHAWAQDAGAPPDASLSVRDDGPPLAFGKKLAVGGYGGLDVAYTRMFGRDGALVGIQGALLLDHRLSLGLAGYGWTNPQQGPSDSFGNERQFETGYGGVTVRYSLYTPSLPVYVSLGALFGGGAIALVNEDDHDGEWDDTDEDVFGVVQPDITLHANLTPWMRLGVTAGYRFTSNVASSGFDESDMNGWVLGGQLQFGSF